MPQCWDISQITYIFITFWRPKVKLFWASGQIFGDNACHPERSEGSDWLDAEILRCAQDDREKGRITDGEPRRIFTEVLSPRREKCYPTAAIPGRLQVVAARLWDVQVDGPDIPRLVIGSMVGQVAIARIELVSDD